MTDAAQKLYPEITSWFQDLNLSERIELTELLIDLLYSLKDDWIAEKAENFCTCDPDCDCRNG